MLVHGDADDVVPVQALFMAVDGLQAAEIPVQWIVRPGLPHSIDPDGIDAAGKFLASMFRGERNSKPLRLLSGFGVVSIGLRDQGGDKSAEQGLSAAAGVMHELEEAEIERQLLL